MKKLILSLFVFVVIVANVSAQSTIVVERPGLLTDLSTALIAVPAAAATGLVQGVVEAGRGIICGSTTVVTTPAPQQVVVTTPVVTTWPTTSVVTTTPAPVVVPGAVIQPAPTTTIVRSYGNGTTITVTRPASGYELGPNVVHPAAPGQAVGPNPLVNPYIRRRNGF